MRLLRVGDRPQLGARPPQDHRRIVPPLGKVIIDDNLGLEKGANLTADLWWIQGDMSGWSRGCVDIKIKVVFFV